jgi:hypothetical protein
MEWLEQEVSPHIAVDTEVIAHGGTALTLLGLKGFTKDVDLGFRTREGLDRFLTALQSQGYEVTRDYRATPTEVYKRLRCPGHVVDVVDLRYPTWNRWRMTNLVLSKAVLLRLEHLTLVRPDRDTIFLFKTYPLRDSDLDDLRSILEMSPPDEATVIELFDEQDLSYRLELDDAQLEYEPLINILELRTRYAGSVSILEPEFRDAMRSLTRHAQSKFLELGLPVGLDEAVSMIREPPVNWDRLLGSDFELLRSKLTA